MSASHVDELQTVLGVLNELCALLSVVKVEDERPCPPEPQELRLETPDIDARLAAMQLPAAAFVRAQSVVLDGLEALRKRTIVGYREALAGFVGGIRPDAYERKIRQRFEAEYHGKASDLLARVELAAQRARPSPQALPPMRRRVAYTDQQLVMLEDAYARNKHCRGIDKKELCIATGLTSSQIQSWTPRKGDISVPSLSWSSSSSSSISAYTPSLDAESLALDAPSPFTNEPEQLSTLDLAQFESYPEIDVQGLLDPEFWQQVMAIADPLADPLSFVRTLQMLY